MIGVVGIRGQEAHPAAFEELAGPLSGLRPEASRHRPGGDLQQAAQFHEGGDFFEIADHVLVPFGVRYHRTDLALQAPVDQLVAAHRNMAVGKLQQDEPVAIQAAEPGDLLRLDHGP